MQSHLGPSPVRNAVEEQRVLARLRARMFGQAHVPVNIGNYELIRPLGAGTSGVVYLAHDPKLERRVAIKVLQGEDPDAQRRLLREAHILARLSHPNVVSVFDVGVFDNRVYVVMEFVEGATLDRWAKRRKSGWREVVRMFQAAGDGLAAVHRAGLLHRDFKPSNVLVDGHERPKLADFGLARVAAAQRTTREWVPVASPATVGTTTQSSIDSVGVVGTPAYMAPELFAGDPADADSDQYAFCVAL